MKSEFFMKNRYDAVIVGAGYAGSVCARVLAEGGRRVLLLERRDHIGGNAYDEKDESGVLIHKYGPHIFHTNDREVYEFLSRFTEWNGYQHRVLGRVGELSMPIPFNLDSLSVAYGKEEAASLEALLIEKYGQDTQITSGELTCIDDAQAVDILFRLDHLNDRFGIKVLWKR